MATPTQDIYIRVVEGREIPIPGRCVVDPAHSRAQFVARHMMLSKVRDYFRELSGRMFVTPLSNAGAR